MFDVFYTFCFIPYLYPLISSLNSHLLPLVHPSGQLRTWFTGLWIMTISDATSTHISQYPPWIDANMTVPTRLIVKMYETSYLTVPWLMANCCISSLALSSCSSLRSCSIFLASAAAFCSAFQTFSTLRSVWGCQLFFKFYTEKQHTAIRSCTPE